MNSFFGLVLLATAVSALSKEEKSRQAIDNPHFYQGDIAGIDPYDRNVIAFPQKRWPRAHVPIVLHSSVERHKNLIFGAMVEFHKKSCVRFVHRSSEQNYIELLAKDGCWSFIGMSGGRQELSLGNGCMNKGIIIHELGHAIGFFHEQNRSDRDKYLNVLWQNIQPGKGHNFQAQPPNRNILYTGFDYDSIMLYGNRAFSRDGRSITLAAKNGHRLLEPYEKNGLSDMDFHEINRMYNC